MLVFFLIPFFTLLGGWTLSRMHETLAGVNGKVKLATLLLNSEKSADQQEIVELTAYKSSGVPATQVYAEASEVLGKFYAGCWVLGCFLGLAFAVTLVRRMMARYQADYTPNKGNCYSCVKCVDYCPVKMNDQSLAENGET